MTGAELQLLDLVQEMMHDLRWMQILAYSNQYLLNRKLEVTDAERNQILEAATRAVDKDGKLHEWNERLDRLKAELHNIKRKVNRARKDIEQGKEAPPGPPLPPGTAREIEAIDPGSEGPADQPLADESPADERSAEQGS